MHLCVYMSTHAHAHTSAFHDVHTEGRGQPKKWVLYHHMSSWTEQGTVSYTGPPVAWIYNFQCLQPECSRCHDCWLTDNWPWNSRLLVDVTMSATWKETSVYCSSVVKGWIRRSHDGHHISQSWLRTDTQCICGWCGVELLQKDAREYDAESEPPGWSWRLHGCTGWFKVNLTVARVIWQQGASAERFPLPDWLEDSFFIDAWCMRGYLMDHFWDDKPRFWRS